MIERIESIGYAVYGKTLGETWLQMVETVIKNGSFELDENRGRFAVHNLRFTSETTDINDELIEKYGDRSKIDAMKRVVFESDVMTDFDITPSFRTGARSFCGSCSLILRIHDLLKSEESPVWKLFYYTWWGWKELNLLPSGYEPPALTDELQPHVEVIIA
jgi:hypothetical protein